MNKKDVVEFLQGLPSQVRAELRDYKNPIDLMGILVSSLRIEEKIDKLIKKDFYNLTNDEIKGKLKDMGLDEKTIKELKNKKEMVDKLVELM